MADEHEFIGPEISRQMALARRQGVAVSKRLKRLTNTLGTAAITQARDQDLLGALVKTVNNAGLSQRKMMQSFANRAQKQYGHMEDPVGALVYFGKAYKMPEADEIRAPWPKVLYTDPHGRSHRNNVTIIRKGTVVDAAATVGASLEIVRDTYRACYELAVNVPGSDPDRPRTYAHSNSFVLAVGQAKLGGIPGGDTNQIRAQWLNAGGVSVDQLESLLESMDYDASKGEAIYLINVIEYASSLESYFFQTGKKGIMYAAWAKMQPKARGLMDMRYSYVNPDALHPDLAEAAKARGPVLEKTGQRREYRYILPAIVFAPPGSFATILNSKPGFKLGRGGSRSVNRNGRKFKPHKWGGGS